MAGAGRLDPGGVAALLRRRWNGGRRTWLDGAGSWPLSILLHPPTEREAARDLAGVRDWIEDWAAVDADPQRPGELLWTERQWPGLGRQRLPERLVLAEPAQVAAWLGEQAPWRVAWARAVALRGLLSPDGDPDPRATVNGGATGGPALRVGRHYDWLADAQPADFERLLAVLGWLIAHPDSGLYSRQLPIPGIDTKWIGAQRARLVDLLAQHWQLYGAGATPGDADLYSLAGLRREPDLMRVRILDPALRAVVGGLGDITAPVEQIAALAGTGAPERVFMVENLQTGLAFDDLPGSVCCMARGYAVEVFAAIPWLRNRPCHYWGDLDTHGFAILSRLRSHLPGVRSLLMDAETLLRHRDLWQREDKPAAGPLARLTADERRVCEGLLTHRWGERVRLEQERIDWGYAWQVIRAARYAP